MDKLFVKATVWVVAATTALLLGNFALFAHASTPTLGWESVTSALMTIDNEPNAQWQDWYQPHCQPVTAIVEDYSIREPRELCVVESDTLSLAVYKQTPGSSPYYAIKKHQIDDVFHRVANIYPEPAFLTLLQNDTLIGASLQQGDALGMYSLAHANLELTSIPIQTGPTTYNTVYQINAQTGYFLPIAMQT